MVAYNFQIQFVDPILSGRKTQTIRAERGGRSRHARPGETLQLYTGMRTRRCRLIGTATCADVAQVTLWLRPPAAAPLIGATIVSAAHGTTGYAPGTCAMEAFAQADGFADAVDMAAWWSADLSDDHRHYLATDPAPALWWDLTLIRWREFAPAAEFALFVPSPLAGEGGGTAAG